jgi:hypothetical protein
LEEIVALLVPFLSGIALPGIFFYLAHHGEHRRHETAHENHPKTYVKKLLFHLHHNTYE